MYPNPYPTPRLADTTPTNQIVSAPMNGFIFTTYRACIHAQTGSADVRPSLTQISIAGGLTGILLSYVSFP